MLIIADKRLPEPAKKVLSQSGKLIEIESSGIVYDAISGHPDIFFCQCETKLLAAPNTSHIIIDQLIENNINWFHGRKTLLGKYPETAHYNAVVTENLLIHNLKITDPEILKISENKEHIHVEQGYTRCNLISLNERGFITSDKGIESVLANSGRNVFFVDPSEILLPGFKNGFFGGCCGIKGNQLFVAGSLLFLNNGDQIKAFAENCGFEIIELYDGPLIDGGGIFFL
jgi:hypothetical protein